MHLKVNHVKLTISAWFLLKEKKKNNLIWFKLMLCKQQGSGVIFHATNQPHYKAKTMTIQ